MDMSVSMEDDLNNLRKLGGKIGKSFILKYVAERRVEK